ncbi:hypothetical protein H6758_00475 [Candidatus Nomurabacteria bacterium]|nr:hypothetical protein [Candidatus Nomurabacteria bacterium]
MGQSRGSRIIAATLFFVITTQLLSASFSLQPSHKEDTGHESHKVGHSPVPKQVHHREKGSYSLEKPHDQHSHEHPDHTEPEEEWILPYLHVQWLGYAIGRPTNGLNSFLESTASHFG